MDLLEEYQDDKFENNDESEDLEEIAMSEIN